MTTRPKSPFSAQRVRDHLQQLWHPVPGAMGCLPTPIRACLGVTSWRSELDPANLAGQWLAADPATPVAHLGLTVRAAIILGENLVIWLLDKPHRAATSLAGAVTLIAPRERTIFWPASRAVRHAPVAVIAALLPCDEPIDRPAALATPDLPGFQDDIALTPEIAVWIDISVCNRLERNHHRKNPNAAGRPAIIRCSCVWSKRIYSRRQAPRN
jgi:hypothetical protein